MLARTPWWRAMTPRAALLTLGLPTNIHRGSGLSQATLKKAYVAATLRCHPDLHPEDPHATEKFRRLSDALRVALAALETRQPTGVVPGDSQGILEALRHAMAAHHSCREETDTHTEEGTDVFSWHSLEYVSSVCRTEAMAMRRVRQFCDEIPEVLCGKSCVLFEAVAFFNARYVEAMSRCVLRFSKNLPIIVSRVVKGRKKYIHYMFNKANSGLGTGNRPRQQRIEDMAMKPLVLVGALIFDQEKKYKVEEKNYSQNKTQNNNNNNNSSNDCKSTCGAISQEDIKICEELKCIIYPSDSIKDITEKIGKWEAASYERLQLELAMVDTTSLLSSMLDLNEHCVAVMHNLHLSKNISENVSLTLQKLVCGLCYHCDEKNSLDNEKIFNEIKVTKENENGKEPEEEETKTSISDEINRCRYLARLAEPYIEGNITLIWDNETSLVETTEEVTAGEEDNLKWESMKKKNNNTNNNNNNNFYYMVVRHMSCCTAEFIKFSVSIKLSKDLGEFLTHLISALESVIKQADLSSSLLPKLLVVREKVVKEEFIPLEKYNSGEEGEEEKEKELELQLNNNVGENKENLEFGISSLHSENNFDISSDNSSNIINENNEKEDDENIEYRYRGSICCFPRIFSMNTSEEFLFWKNIYINRIYLAEHTPSMNPINIYYNCLPYKSHSDVINNTNNNNNSNNKEILSGWVGESEDGTDDAIITFQELENNSTFREWLEEIVEQSSINKECNRIVNEAGVGYIIRDPTLPLIHYLSFVKVFCAATGVREIIEHKSGKTRTVTSDDTGFIIVVGSECDVRDGGRLIIPWWIDPSTLLTLLQDSSEGTGSLIESGEIVE